jgi:diphthine methyl ester acylhydrolase
MSSDGFAVTFSDGRTSVFSTPALPAQQGERGKEEEEQYDIAKGNGLDLIETQFEPRDGVAIEAWFVALATYREEQAGDSSKKLSSFIFTGDDFGSLNTRKFCAPDEEEDDDDQTSTGISLEECMISDTSDRARHHTAGVTAILPLPIEGMVENEPILLTGSYDEYIRVYHANSRKGAILAEQRLGGGVWRLEVVNTEATIGEEADAESAGGINFLVLASCMHAGTRVVKVTWKRKHATEVGEWDIQVLAQFTEHESMNYASGVWKGNKSASELVCVSSSFYDKRLCLWKLQI